MAEAQDVDTLKRRGRRRLVGAVALVLLAVVVLPMVFDPEPRRPAPPVSVRIPGEDETAFAPKLAPPKVVPEKKAEAPKPAPAAEKKAEEATPPLKEQARAEAAVAGAEYIIPVGAFANAGAVTAKLAQAKIPYYTESLATAKGSVTRVRAGPFASKAAADQAMEKLKGLGLKPGNVATRQG
ncbi:MAG TPA: SPOR domain-containing protein [Burkholderiales bacterium]